MKVREVTNRMDVSGDVCLIPGDNAELYVPSGITVPSCSSLTVYARRTGDSMGACIVDAPAGGCAGIGGAPNTACSSGAIAGGRITVQGVFYTAGGAGISGGGMRLGGGIRDDPGRQHDSQVRPVCCG